MNINLHIIVDDIASEISSMPGDGSPRLYESSDALYIFNIPQFLFRSGDGGTTFLNVAPGDAIRVYPITQTIDSKTIINYSRDTALSMERVLRWQKSPETDTGWLSTIDQLEAASEPYDCIADDLGGIPILFGNRHQGSEARIERMATAPPAGVFVRSDSGLSTGTVRITDLECYTA